MELKSLLNKHQWSKSDFEYSKTNVEQAIRPQAVDNIKRLFQHYYRTIVLNSLLMILTFGLYLVKPTPEIFIPIGLIALGFLLIIVPMLYYLIFKERPDTSKSLREFLEETIKYNKGIYKYQCESGSVILTTAFVGGFFLGTILTGNSLSNEATIPFYIVLSVLTVSFYFFTKSKSFKAINRKLNPNYNKIKRKLEQHLLELTTD